jgi:hypothetical protein
METKQRDSSEILRLIESSPDIDDAGQTPQAELQSAGIDPDAFVFRVRHTIDSVLGISVAGPSILQEKPVRQNIIRTLSFAALAVSAVAVAISVVLFVAFYYPAGVDAQRQLARVQLISPLLPALASGDPQQRSMALAVAQQVDATFASETAKKLAQWDVDQLQAKTIEMRARPYSSRIAAGLQKLQFSRNPDDRKAAIWNDLLPVLKEAQKNRDDFFAVAIEYRKVLPYLRVEDPDVFLDSYWGELWILNILLDSRITPVVEAARRTAPKPAIVEQIYQKQAPTLPEEKRKAFEQAVAVYADELKTNR